MKEATMQRKGEGPKQGDTGERRQGKSRPDRKERNEASFPEAPERRLTKEPASGRANVETLRVENKWGSEGVVQSKASRLHAGPRRPLAAPSALPRDPHGKSRTQSVSS